MSRIPPFVGEASATASLDSFRKWNKQWRPDSLLCLQGEELKWLQLGISFQNEMALVCLNRPAESDYTGVTENNTLIGKLTCDIVINHIIHNVRGLSPHPSLISVKGDWIEGSTLPDRIS
jgi:LacI family transcriptional regulator